MTNKRASLQIVRVDNGFVIASSVKSMIANNEEELEKLLQEHYPDLIKFLNSEEQSNNEEQSRIVTPNLVAR